MFTRRNDSKKKSKGPQPLVTKNVRTNYGKCFKKSETVHTDEDLMVKDCPQTEPTRDDGVVSRDKLYRDRFAEPEENRDALHSESSRIHQKQNYIEKALNNAKPVDMGPGLSMLQRMGWTGGGLGRSGEGITEPITPNASYVSGSSRNYGTGNLSGAAKRRFVRMCKANIPPEKAIHLCRKTLKELKIELRNSDRNSAYDRAEQNYSPQEGMSQNDGLRKYGPDDRQNVGPSQNNPPRSRSENDRFPRNFGTEDGQKYGLSENNPYSGHSQNDGLSRNFSSEDSQNFGLSPNNPYNLDPSQIYGLSQNYVPDKTTPNNSSNFRISQDYALDKKYSNNSSNFAGLSDYRPDNNSPSKFASSDDNCTPNRSEGSHRPVLVGIYDYRMMNEDQMNILHRALNREILKLGAKGIGPRFLGLDHKEGWVEITCEDELSKDWLVDEVPKLEPWPGARLSVRIEDFTQNEIVIAFIPQYEAQSIDEALNLLAVQNEGLNTEKWKVFSGKEAGNGLIVTFSIDDQSLKTLKANNLKAVLGFRTIHFKVKGRVDPFEISLKNWFDVDDGARSECDTSEPLRSLGTRREMYRDVPFERRPNTCDILDVSRRDDFTRRTFETSRRDSDEPFTRRTFETSERDREESFSPRSFDFSRRDRIERNSLRSFDNSRDRDYFSRHTFDNRRDEIVPYSRRNTERSSRERNEPSRRYDSVIDDRNFTGDFGASPRGDFENSSFGRYKTRGYDFERRDRSPHTRNRNKRTLVWDRIGSFPPDYPARDRDSFESPSRARPGRFSRRKYGGRRN